jgi:short-subunit dehydrogenase
MELRGACALLTGASRGIGVSIADALASRGVDLVLTARNPEQLSQVAQSLAKYGTRVVTLAADLADRDAPETIAREASAALGRIDLLVNNAAIEHGGYFHELAVEDIDTLLTVNLRAPLILTRLLLPSMIERDHGHVVHVASVAGLGPAAFNEPYGASKHGMVGFSRASRASLQTMRSKVSSSVVCPGYVSEAGMFFDSTQGTDARPPVSVGSSRPSEVAAGVIRAVVEDLPELIVNPVPLRPFLALNAALPKLAERIFSHMGAHETFQKIADARARRAGGRGV